MTSTTDPKQPVRVNVFLSGARLLGRDEIQQVMSETGRSVSESDADGLWIELTCPDRSCIGEDGRITLPPEKESERGLFLNLFCPEDSCRILENTDLP